MLKILITFLVISLAVPAAAETMRERLQKARERERMNTDKLESETGSAEAPPKPVQSSMRNGILRVDYPDGSPREIAEFRKGRREGETKLYYENGQLESRTMYADDRADGKSETYYSTGKIKSEEEFRDGELDGPRKEYYESGKIKVEENYVNGKLEGTKTVYHINGKVQSTTEYINGQQEGKISEYYLYGPIGRETYFEGGKKLWEKKYVYNDKGDDPSRQLFITETLFDENGRQKQTNRYDASGKLIYTQ